MDWRTRLCGAHFAERAESLSRDLLRPPAPSDAGKPARDVHGYYRGIEHPDFASGPSGRRTVSRNSTGEQGPASRDGGLIAGVRGSVRARIGPLADDAAIPSARERRVAEVRWRRLAERGGKPGAGGARTSFDSTPRGFSGGDAGVKAPGVTPRGGKAGRGGRWGGESMSGSGEGGGPPEEAKGVGTRGKWEGSFASGLSARQVATLREIEGMTLSQHVGLLDRLVALAVNSRERLGEWRIG